MVPDRRQVIETPYQDALEKWKARLGLDPHRALHDRLNLPLADKPRTKRMHTRAIDRLKSVLAYPDVTMSWVPFALDAIKKIDVPIDAILSSAPPITSHVIAKEARRILKCPWIADFRDLWAANLDNPNGAVFSSRIEPGKRWLRSADALVTVSRPWVDRLQDLYPDKRIHVITNGFDPGDFAGNSKRSSYFSISYTGQLYAGRRDPTLLFEVIHELIEESIVVREQIRIRFYGPIEPWLQPLIERYDLKGVVELHGSIHRTEALRRQQESQILLLLGWANPREIGQHTGKLFEYFGSRRPILAVGGVRESLPKYWRKPEPAPRSFQAQLRQFLIESYAEFRERGEVRFTGESTNS